MAVGGAPIDLEKTFDLMADGPHFAKFIDRLRDNLRDASWPPLFHGVSALRPFSDGPIQWLHLRVRGRASAIVLRLRTNNLYTEAFVREDQQFSDQSWWEFQGDGGTHRQLIRGSRSLGFTGGYTPRGMGDLRGGVELGMQPLENAINGLANYNGGDHSAAKGWLRTVIVTFSEAIRLRNVTSHVAGLLQNHGSGMLEATNIEHIRNWQKISTCLILGARNSFLEPVLYGELKAINITNNFQACQVLGIVYKDPKKVEEKEKERNEDEKKFLEELMRTYAVSYAQLTVKALG